MSIRDTFIFEESSKNLWFRWKPNPVYQDSSLIYINSNGKITKYIIRKKSTNQQDCSRSMLNLKEQLKKVAILNRRNPQEFYSEIQSKMSQSIPFNDFTPFLYYSTVKEINKVVKEIIFTNKK